MRAEITGKKEKNESNAAVFFVTGKQEIFNVFCNWVNYSNHLEPSPELTKIKKNK